MKWLWLVLIVGVFGVVPSCKTSTQKFEPAGRGKRGETCQARNDCASGLACISGVCSRNDFDISVTAKHCDRIDCSSTRDCCGSKPTQAPDECENYGDLCEPQLAGCIQGSTCEDNGDCGRGSCEGYGFCNVSSQYCTSDNNCYGADVCSGGYCQVLGTMCVDDSDCYASDTCTTGGYCSRSYRGCSSDLDCYVSDACESSVLTCNCTNPDYNPSEEICSDSDCFDICQLRCQNELCVEDTSCEVDADCSGGFTCGEDDRCVECVDDDDCDDDETCTDGYCERGCEEDEECPLFHECDDGECVEVGCKSDRECVLAASMGSSESGSEDARLYQCLPSDLGGEDFNVCKIPCENDGACGSDFQVCDQGFCVFIGCQNDEDCRALLRLANQEVTDERPFVSKAVCRE